MSHQVVDLDLTRKIIVDAHLEAKDEDSAIKMQQYLLAIKRNTHDTEPGCLTFRLARFGRIFVVFEEYENGVALKTHHESRPVQDLIVAGKDILAKPPTVTFYNEINT
ncbi:hypothetical protein FRB96_001338 [Tulasnella sp. 330]|nr:hypothetical protein FRB96_001338 [Tulasnella sp. 330]KAG8880418.1 hypothetical protein FRB97_000782 [Tulasnella sp. 331]KAG8888388.1 hypothetical protein FRB98_007783 [Tulasnella sp. 332]